MIKVAILIDGGYLLKRLPAVRPDIDVTNAESVAKSIEQLVRGHLEQLNKTSGASPPATFISLFLLRCKTLRPESAQTGQQAVG